MTSIVTGLFPSQLQAGKISQDLEDAGFRNSDYIMYLHDRGITKEVKTSIWQYFFGDNRKLEDESLVISVRVNGPVSTEIVERIFKQNDSIHQNYYENIKFEDAKSLDYLRRIASLRARAEIRSSPEIRTREQSRGINAEVAFGR
ncbi:DUF5312 domain-containing protein [Chryseobacterium suipulveris]|uniref:DUF5312 domain-containing protein n=1 Tax=Chryseobacterium suipulveris TaxID=2929800 RepID=A0ABY4BPC0_9FLAO|nr:DUF5312 domain-containing protein [Chryseobacterium suipulveris]UOE40082.1 DUF5312 domain-containing protein [Chryseobacterium suipulveris]